MDIDIYLPESNKKAWDAYVMNHPESTHCHLSVWKEIIEETYAHRGYYLFAHNGGECVGILPLIHIKSILFGNTLVSMPYLNYGGVLSDSDEISGRLLDRAIQIASKLGASMELRHIRSLGDRVAIPSGSQFAEKTHKVRMLLNLPKCSDELFKSFNSKVRSQIRRPQREGMQAEIGGAELLHSFYGVLSSNMRDLGSPVHSRLFYEKILSGSNPDFDVKIGTIFYQDTAVAAGLICRFGETVEIPWASSLRLYNHYSPNMLLYWSLLEYSCKQGAQYFDFGRSSPDGGTYRFKKQWNARPDVLHWFLYGPDVDQIDSDEKEDLPGRFMSLAASAWKRLPLPVVNLIGPRIRGYLSQ